MNFLKEFTSQKSGKFDQILHLDLFHDVRHHLRKKGITIDQKFLDSVYKIKPSKLIYKTKKGFLNI